MGGKKVLLDSCEALTFTISNIEKLKKKLAFYEILYTENECAKNIVVQDPDGYKLQVAERMNRRRGFSGEIMKTVRCLSINFG